MDTELTHRVMLIIANNLPSPYALDIVWRQTKSGAVFDFWLFGH